MFYEGEPIFFSILVFLGILILLAILHNLGYVNLMPWDQAEVFAFLHH